MSLQGPAEVWAQGGRKKQDRHTGRCKAGSLEPPGRRRPVRWAEPPPAPWDPPCFPSQHHPGGQPGPLHPAGRRGRHRLQQHSASRAGRRGCRRPGTAAGEPYMGGEALTPPTAPAGARSLAARPGRCELHPVSLCLQVVVQRGLASRARQLLADSGALEEAVLGEQRRLGLGECRVQLGVRAPWGPSPSGHVGRHRVNQGRGCPLWEFSPLLGECVPGSSAKAHHPPWPRDTPPGRGRAWGRGRGARLMVSLMSWLRAVCMPGRRGGAGGEWAVGCALCC